MDVRELWLYPYSIRQLARSAEVDQDRLLDYILNAAPHTGELELPVELEPIMPFLASIRHPKPPSTRVQGVRPDGSCHKALNVLLDAFPCWVTHGELAMDLEWDSDYRSIMSRLSAKGWIERRQHAEYASPLYEYRITERGVQMIEALEEKKRRWVQTRLTPRLSPTP